MWNPGVRLMWRQTENAFSEIADRGRKRQRREQNGDEQERGAQRKKNPKPDVLHMPNENKLGRH